MENTAPVNLTNDEIELIGYLLHEKLNEQKALSNWSYVEEIQKAHDKFVELDADDPTTWNVNSIAV